MDFNDRFKQLRKDADIIPDITKNNKETDIITQLSNYNYLETENKINEFKKILDNQKNLNQILVNNNSKQDKQKIETFIQDNSELIDQQFNKLNELNKELKLITNDNNQLIKQCDEYKQLINSNNYKNIANKIRDINKNCSDINYFLMNTGILNI